MSSINEVGISPVLLQAISQSLTATSPKQKTTTAPSDSENMESTNGSSSSTSEQDMVSRLLQQSQSPSTSTAASASDTIKTMLKIKMAANALSKSILNEDGTINTATISKSLSRNDASSLYASSASDLAMANMLTALASHSSKSSQDQSGAWQEGVNCVTKAASEAASNDTNVRAVMIGGQKVLIRTGPVEDTDNVQVSNSNISQDNLKESDTNDERDVESMYTIIKREPGSIDPAQLRYEANLEVDNQAAISYSSTSVTSDSNINILTSVAAQVEGARPKSSSPATVVTENPVVTLSSVPAGSSANSNMVVCYNAEGGSQEMQSIIVSQNTGQQIIEHDGKRYIIHTTNIPSGAEAASATKYIAIQSSSGGLDGNGEAFTGMAEQEVVSEEGTTTIAVPVYTDPGAPGATGTPCPICSDHVSGFHYGIFTCESCKGFFKRTVQNKKTFLCHRQGECEITLENRKKCPACRFAKCLVMGMKLEAIRLDRTRGGRSSYSGLSPLDEAKRKRQHKIVQRRPNIPSPSDSRLVTVLSYGDNSVGKPFVPQILTDIMNLESLLCDDDIPASISGDNFSITDPNVFLTLLQLCELKLYKIVRWARNLPYFANISTDDQILLLQNCWCELLALTMCWRSIHLSSEVVFFHGQTIDLEKANVLEIGEMFTMLLSVVEQFKRLKLDNYECVALKVIILICPDIKGLNDADKLGEQQAKVSAALEVYTSCHYQNAPNKFGEVILRLGELSRISGLLKEHLVSWMPPNTTSCGLLYELLKGEHMKDLV